VAYVRSLPEEKGLPVTDIVAGSRLIAGAPAKGYRRVVLPDGRAGFMRESELGGLPVPARPSREGIVSRAKRYLGINYIWGGTSPKGFDCSGLVKRVFEMEGVDLPRDTDRQARMGREVPIERAEPADLLFFGESATVSHVAIYLGEESFIHSYGAVRINGLRAGDGSFDPKLAGRLKFVRSVLP
jgi:cell wall-associated NlpC family hydrolase